MEYAIWILCLDGLVETSLSNGVLEQKDGKLYLTTLLRSSNKAGKLKLKDVLN